MTTPQILEELPKLPSEEVEAIYHRAEEILCGETANPELLAAVDKADARPLSEAIGLDEMREFVRTWKPTK